MKSRELAFHQVCRASRGRVIFACLAVVMLSCAGAAIRAAEKAERGLESLLENRPRLNYEELGRRFQNLDNLSDKELERELGAFEAAHATARENWNRLQSVRSFRTAVMDAVELRAANMTLRLWQAARERNAKLDNLYAMEREAYEKRFGEIEMGRYGIKPKSRKNWQGTPEYERFRRAEGEIDNWFTEETARITREAREGKKEGEKSLDQIQHEILKEYRWTAQMVKQVKRRIARRRGEKIGEEEETEEEEKRLYGLRFVPTKTAFELEVGETAEAWFNIFKGAPPYYLMVIAPSHGTRDFTIAKPGFTMVPFSFEKAGDYTARAVVYDDHGAHKEVSLTFTVTEKEGEKEVKEEKKPEEEKKKEEVVEEEPLPEGALKALLWAQLVEWPGTSVKVRNIWLPTPLTISVGADGTLRGRCRYEVPQSEFEFEKTNTVWAISKYWRTRFEIEGTIDEKAETAEIRLVNGRAEYGYDFYSGKKRTPERVYRWAWEVDFDATLRGLRTRGPKAEAWLEKVGAGDWKKGFGVAFWPRVIVEGSEGKPRFTCDGWFSVGGMAAYGGPAELTIKKWLVTSGFVNRGLDTQNLTTEKRAFYLNLSKRYSWCLQILGKAEEEEKEEEPPEGDLIATGIWPPKPVRLTVGQTVKLQFVGVYAENVSEVVDLSKKATWRSTPGLERVGPGTYRAVRAGTHHVRAGVKKRGEWMTGLATFEVVAPPAGP